MPLNAIQASFLFGNGQKVLERSERYGHEGKRLAEVETGHVSANKHRPLANLFGLIQEILRTLLEHEFGEVQAGDPAPRGERSE